MSVSHSRMATVVLGFAVVLACAPSQGNEQSMESEGVFEVSAALCKHMQAHHVLNPGAPLGCDRLKLVKFNYIGFDGQLHRDGKLIVLDAVANHVLQIFDALRSRSFPIASAKLMDQYNGDDEASMAQNNSSSFNVRPIAGGGSISLHAYGAAIDLNPVQNPYLKRTAGILAISPKSGADYTNRKTLRPGMAETVVSVFADHGFPIWGGRWKNPIDYQHFQLSLALAKQLAHLSSTDAQALFEHQVAAARTAPQR